MEEEKKNHFLHTKLQLYIIIYLINLTMEGLLQIYFFKNFDINSLYKGLTSSN